MRRSLTFITASVVAVALTMVLASAANAGGKYATGCALSADTYLGKPPAGTVSVAFEWWDANDYLLATDSDSSTSAYGRYTDAYVSASTPANATWAWVKPKDISGATLKFLRVSCR